ncbi:MAG: hypothetical protein ACOX1Z_04755 [Candidatus Ratteibacteria bacterium]
MNNSCVWKKIRITGDISYLFPLILLVIGIIMAKQGFAGMVKNYEEGTARFIQYLLFAIGIAIFFFSDSVSDFLQKRIFVKDSDNKPQFYMSYILLSLWLLNIIAITGFTGFLICGNIYWLSVFVILNLAIGIKYVPSQKKMAKLITKVKT